jgi:hypothetical protein
MTHDEIRDEALRRIKAQLEAACSVELPPWLRAVGEMWHCSSHPHAGADTFIDVERNALILRCKSCGQDLTISPVVRVDTFECPAGLPPEPPIPIVAFSVESKADVPNWSTRPKHVEPLSAETFGRAASELAARWTSGDQPEPPELNPIPPWLAEIDVDSCRGCPFCRPTCEDGTWWGCTLDRDNGPSERSVVRAYETKTLPDGCPLPAVVSIARARP